MYPEFLFSGNNKLVILKENAAIGIIITDRWILFCLHVLVKYSFNVTSCFFNRYRTEPYSDVEIKVHAFSFIFYAFPLILHLS